MKFLDRSMRGTDRADLRDASEALLYRSEDFGATWTPLHAGLPDLGSVNVILEHPDNPDVLFLGTERALFASTDAGA